jgi:hypothetical protein
MELSAAYMYVILDNQLSIRNTNKNMRLICVHVMETLTVFWLGALIWKMFLTQNGFQSVGAGRQIHVQI